MGEAGRVPAGPWLWIFAYRGSRCSRPQFHPQWHHLAGELTWIPAGKGPGPCRRRRSPDLSSVTKRTGRQSITLPVMRAESSHQIQPQKPLLTCPGGQALDLQGSSPGPLYRVITRCQKAARWPNGYVGRRNVGPRGRRIPDDHCDEHHSLKECQGALTGGCSVYNTDVSWLTVSGNPSLPTCPFPTPWVLNI